VGTRDDKGLQQKLLKEFQQAFSGVVKRRFLWYLKLDPIFIPLIKIIKKQQFKSLIINH
jgi:hypothetical protein